MKGKFLVAPDGGAADCYHSNYKNLPEARIAAGKLAKENFEKYAVFEKIAVVEPEPIRVKWRAK